MGYNPKTVSIIVLLTRKTISLKSILSLESEIADWVEFILVVDNPEQEFIKWVRETVENSKRIIRLITNKKNLGIIKSRNIGLEKAEGDLILYLDDDIIPNEKLIDHHLEDISNTNYIGVIGSTIFSFNRSRSFHNALALSGMFSTFNMSNICKYHSWGPTCNISILKNKLKNIKFRNELSKLNTGEDVDFCWQLMKANNNRKFKVSKRARVIHPPWQGTLSTLIKIKNWGKCVPFICKFHPEKKFINWPDFWLTNSLLIIIFVVIGIFISPIYFINIIFGLFLSILIPAFFDSIYFNNKLSTSIIIESIVLFNLFGRFQSLFKNFNIRFLLHQINFKDYTNKKLSINYSLRKFIFIIFSWLFPALLITEIAKIINFIIRKII